MCRDLFLPHLRRKEAIRRPAELAQLLFDFLQKRLIRLRAKPFTAGLAFPYNIRRAPATAHDRLCGLAKRGSLRICGKEMPQQSGFSISCESISPRILSRFSLSFRQSRDQASGSSGSPTFCWGQSSFPCRCRPQTQLTFPRFTRRLKTAPQYEQTSSFVNADFFFRYAAK